MKKALSMVIALLCAALLVAGCGSTQSGSTSVKMQPTFFVSANGQDSNNGRSEKTAFQTLARAVQAAMSSSVRTITVLGTISGTTTEITNGGPGEIVITGTPNVPGVVSVSENHVFDITNSTVRFEHILLTGGMTGGIYLKERATVTLGSGAALKKNSGALGALIVNTGCTATMQDNAEISGNTAIRGAGAAVWGTLTMKDNAVIKDNDVSTGRNAQNKRQYGYGGGIYIEDGKLIMQDNAVISGNKAFWGGGIYNWGGTVTLQGNAKITGNSLLRFIQDQYGGSGGGLYNTGTSATFTMSGHATISENTAGFGAGIYMSGGKVTLRDDASVSNNSIVYWTNPDDKDDTFGNNGAGIMVTAGCTLTMEGQSVISGNEAGVAGGGVWVANDATAVFIQKGGSITNNSANYGGGVYLVGAQAVYTQTGGSVIGNVGKIAGPDIRLAPQQQVAETPAVDDMAIQLYTLSIQINPNDAEVYLNRGIAYADKGDYDHALEDFTQAIRLNPNYVEAYTNRSGIYTEYKRDYDRALADYNEAIRLDPNLAIAYAGRGNVYSVKENTEEAIANYTQAIRLDPNYVQVYNNRGTMYVNKEDYDRAIADYTQAIRLDPNYAQAYNNRGAAYYHKKDYAHARADWEQVLRLNPNDASTRNNLEVLKGMGY